MIKQNVLFILAVVTTLASCAGSPPMAVTLDTATGQLFSGSGSITLPDSAVYNGQFSNGLLDGRGVMQYRNGASYIGEFKKGLFDGHGILITGSGEKLEGKFSQGTMNGHGKMELTGGTTYEGDFSLNQFSGNGKLVYATGDIYEGGFRNGVVQGRGVFTYVRGDQYIGEVANGEFNGIGTYVYANHDMYYGEFRNSLFEGPGRYISYGGKVYIGDFNKGQFEGTGTIEAPGQYQYSGEVENWKPEGKGTMETEYGDRYEGEFQNGRYHGTGVYYSGKSKYEGQFQDGMYHGKGTMYLVNKNGETRSVTTEWEYGSPKNPSDELIAELTGREKRPRLNSEEVLYRQYELLNTTLATIKPQRKQQSDMYFIAFAAYGTQDVFKTEAYYTRSLFDSRFDTGQRSIALVNNVKTPYETPLASVTNLKKTLQYIAADMDTEDDILFMYLTSHGSKDNKLAVGMGEVDLNDLSPQQLKAFLDETKIKWRIIVVSACYSGGFVEALQDEHTMVITSSRKDRKSFGCSDDAEFTYFGKAFFKDSVETAESFKTAFEKASALVNERETKQKYKHSEPQFAAGKAILAKLAQWRSQFKSRNLVQVKSKSVPENIIR